MAAAIDDQVAELERANAQLRRQLDACSAELKEAHDQQTATAEVLQVINSSPGDLAPVFDAMLERAVRLCEAASGQLAIYDGEFFHFVAAHGEAAFVREQLARRRIAPSWGVTWPLQLKGDNTVHIDDMKDSEAYRIGHESARRFVDVGGGRTLLSVALRKEEILLGTITVYRREVRPFSKTQIALLENFAAQAVIAMENARLLTETREALEQQTATAEVLQVINSSPGNLAPVFGAVLARSIRLCEASFGVLWTYDGERFHAAALRNVPTPYAEFLTRAPYLPEPEGAHGRLVNGESLIHIVNVADTELYRSGGPLRRALVDLGGARSAVAVALRKDDALLGMVVVYRQEVRPFSDKQIALLQNFAAQAVIAMENARLLTETQEALEQQTATAEVLQVINSSPGNLTPVFDAMLEKAIRLCGGVTGVLWTIDGEQGHVAAARGLPTDFIALLQERGESGTNPGIQRVVRGDWLFELPDIGEAEDFRGGDAKTAARAGVRSLVWVALVREGVAVGAFAIGRPVVGRFSEKQIVLLQNFAAQAVIAMENARLITETREALEQQTATADVLQVINSSPGDLTPVFEAILEKAHTLCGAAHGSLNIYDGEFFHAVAMHGQPEAFAAVLRRPRSGSPVHQRLQAGERFVHIADMKTLTVAPSDIVTPAAIEAGIRTQLFVPLRKDRVLLGYITAHRREVRPFSEKDIALLENFAAQAVIAIENARLITETREALEQQTATAEVLQVINSSPGDLAPVFDAILEKAHSLCEAPRGGLVLYDGEYLRAVAVRGFSGAFADRLRQGIRGPETYFEAPLLAGERFIHIADLAVSEHPDARAGTLAGTRTLLSVPLRKGDALLGMIIAARTEVRPFSEKQIALLQNFAAQAVIAMENARLITETREALEQQTATAEVLQVINSSPGDLAPVFDAMLDKAMRLCEATFGFLSTYDGEHFHAVALHGVPEKYAEAWLSAPYLPGPNTTHDRLIRGEPLIHIPDLAADAVDNPRRRAVLELGGVRTILAVPLRKDGTLLGAIHIYRQEVRPFTDKQIALLQNFAAQAVIAMENARLINETREALEQQTATAEVLQVINASPGDLAPVFDAMLEKALRLCEASFGVLCTYDETAFRAAALRGVPAAYAEFLTVGPLRPGPGNGLMRVAAGEKVVHVVDLAADDVYRSGETLRRALVDLGGARSALTVALLKDELLLGAFIIYRREVRAFTDKQIALVLSFAAQAVIAMENARLITETREALEQQTATAEVLQVINSSPGDLAPVFDAMLDKALDLCGAAFGNLWTFDGKRFRAAALRRVPKAYADALAEERPPTYSTGTVLGKIIAGAASARIEDAAAEEAYRSSSARTLIELGGGRSVAGVALRKDDQLLGAITIYRQEVRPFSDKQIALLQNFAAQAVIAIENARLLTETREALERQTATAEVLQVINSSPGDLVSVFDTILEKAHTLCGAAHGIMMIRDGERFRTVAVNGVGRAFVDAMRQLDTIRPREGGGPARLIQGEQIVQFADLQAESFLQDAPPQLRRVIEIGDARTMLMVPLRKDDDVIGIITAFRQEVRLFTNKQIALLQNFAAQAVIAMENARLITETREALEQQTATAEVLQVINSSPGDLAPVFEAMLDKATSLCEADIGILFTYHEGSFAAVAWHGTPTPFREFLTREPLRPSPDTGLGRMALERRLVHLADVAERDSYRQGDPLSVASVELGGIRTFTAVPLVKDDILIGAFVLYRQEVRSFTDKQIALLENFAAQAVIAMENARLLTETREALEQQTATAEVLQVINSSPGDLTPVFDAILEKARSLCGAVHGALVAYEGEHFRAVATHGLPEPLDGLLRTPFRPEPGSPHELLLAGQRLIHIADQAAQEQTNAIGRSSVQIAGTRTLLFIPLRKDDALFGYISAFRPDVRPFSEKQIALLQNFAAQAVIAMENARLITETREALDQQTATAEVLQVINSSPGDLAPVFDAILEKAHSLCGAVHGVLQTYDGEHFRAVAMRGIPEKFAELLRQPFRPTSGAPHERLLRGERLIHIPDVAAREPTTPIARAAADAGERTVLFVPLRKDDGLLGYITAYRKEVRPFSDKEIALLQNFAAQAVIAMENARLLGELRKRTRDLQESLEYQTATSDVLKVISQSTFDLEPVLQTVLDTAIRLCGNSQGEIFRLEDGVYRMAVGYGMESEYHDIEAKLAITPGPDTLVGRTALAGRPVQIVDALADLEYQPKDDARIGKLRTMLGVPLLREGVPIGVICTARKTVEPFTEKQIALVTTFADQAVIAIENARLLNELRARTDELGRSVEELKMLGEVGRAVSSTLDLSAVLSTILTASLGVTWANAGAVFRYSRAERAFRLVEAVGWDEALARSVGEMRVAESETAMGQAIAARGPVELPDLAALPSTPLRDETVAAGFHSALIVPLVGAERIFGTLVLQRREAGEFPAETVRLMQTLASQSVLAIQNARLFREIADKSEQLALASEHKSQFLANMSHELRTPLNAILGYAELLVDGIYGVLPEKAQGVLERVQNNGKHLLALINDVLDLAKIEAGQLALTLEDYALAEVVRSVVTATEPLAAAKGLKFTAIVQEGLPMAHGDARRVSQVLLNLAGNAIKFTDAGEVEINVSAANGQFLLEVRDTGPGIADADQERIFGEFQQIENNDTRKKGGTGLGLAISKRMVEMQGGMISVQSTLGRGSTFRVVLPVHVEPALEGAA